MAVLGVITVILTVFVIIFYSYLSHNTDHDVSFFLSVGFISLIMNLCTNAGGGFALSWLYLAIAILFIGLGFAVTVHGSVAFYASIGPWFKAQAADLKLLGWKVLSFLLFPAGIVLYFVCYKKNAELARVCGRCALFGLLFWAVLLWLVLGLVL